MLIGFLFLTYYFGFYGAILLIIVLFVFIIVFVSLFEKNKENKQKKFNNSNDFNSKVTQEQKSKNLRSQIFNDDYIVKSKNKENNIHLKEILIELDKSLDPNTMVIKQKDKFQNKILSDDNHVKLKKKDTISSKNKYVKYNMDSFKSLEQYILLDFETNSHNKKDVIEAAAYKLVHDENEYKIVDTFHRYYFSRYPINEMALSVHNLTPERIIELRHNAKYAKYFEDDQDFIEFCNEANILIAHNISFELRYLDDLVKFREYFCTMKENKSIVKALNTKGHIKNPKLTETLNYYKISFNSNKLHGALYDIDKTLEVLNCMNQEENNFHTIKHCILKNKKVKDDERRKNRLKKEKQLIKLNEKKERSLRKKQERNLCLKDIECPKCSSEKIHKKDKRERKTYIVQRYQCVDCKVVFQKKIIENHNKEFETFNFNGIVPTEEQQKIILAADIHNTIKINAFAGTGKTLTLQMLTKFYSDKSFLYLAYNKAIQLESKEKFDKNVEVQTIHAMAYKYVANYSTLNLKNIINYSPKSISDLFDVNYKMAKEILFAFNTYCQSEFVEITNLEQSSVEKKSLMINSSLNGYIEIMINKIENQEIDVSFNYILKKFHLLLESGLKISFFNTIMLDEAQDCNAVILSIVKLLESKHKIIVGDKHQQIYGFNGSVNAMNELDGIDFYLTKTFRLPSDITIYANHVLEHFKHEKIKIKSDKSQYDFTDIYNDLTKNIAYICRGNSSLLLRMKNLSIENKKYKTVRHPKEIFLLLKDIAHFFNDNKEQISFQNSFLKYIKDDDAFIDYFVKTNDSQLEMYFRIYKSIFSESLEEIEILEKEAISYFISTDNIRNVLTTAHSAKGLEFDAVIIEDDFWEFSSIICDLGYCTYQKFIDESKNTVYDKLIEEFNIFYVAITRAKFAIKIESSNIKYLMSEWLTKLDESLFSLSTNPLKACYNAESKKSYQNTYENFESFYNKEQMCSNKNELINDYTILGLKPNTSKIDIKIQYKKLMRKYHPDLTKDKKDEYTELAKKINSAYDNLMKLNA